MIAVEGLTIAAPGGQPIVDDVSLAIARGEAVGLVGPSGCGKSTLALALLDHHRAGCRRTAGTVRAEGRVALVPQDPGGALTPTMRVGDLVTEVVEHHRTAADPRAHTLALFAAVNLPDLTRRYPHELSGGQRQRVAIAAALAMAPALLVLDEPTTGLDARNRDTILELLRGLKATTALLLISHDREAVASLADRVLAMRAGRLVPDVAPPPLALPPATPPRAGPRLVVRDLCAGYRGRRVLENLSFTIEPGTTLAVEGESGAGKSTLARVLSGLLRPESGTATFGDHDLTVPAERRSRALHDDLQIVFQNPDSSLNPRHTVARMLGERAAELLSRVHLTPRVLPLFPAQLSGGERQRVAIARAFATNPKLVICDEVLAALDADLRGAILALLLELQALHGTSYLFITHDPAVLRELKKTGRSGMHIRP